MIFIMSDKTITLDQAILRGTSWLTYEINKRAQASDWPQDLQAHYKIPLALYTARKPILAAKHLELVKEIFFDHDGHFRENNTTLPYLTYCYFYRDWWLVSSANLLRDESANKINAKIANLQTPYGFRWSSNSSNTSLLATSIGGLNAIFAGNLDSGYQAAKAVSETFKIQSDLNNCFYFNRTSSGELIKDISSPWMVYTPNHPKPLYYVFGLSIYLLAMASKTNSDSKFLEDALALHSFYVTHCGTKGIKHPYSGKIGLASSLLYKLTKNQDCLQTAWTVVNYITDRQSVDGRWSLNEFIRLDESNRFSVEIDRTAEYIILLSWIRSNLWSE